MDTEKQTLLNQKIEDLPLTGELKNVCVVEKIDTLQNLLDIEVFNWHKKIPGFNYHHQQEIVSYLKKEDLMEFLKED